MYILLLTSGIAEIYHVTPKGASVIHLPSGLNNSEDLVRFAMGTLDIPWAILVDQSEESFWGGVMPPLRGAVKDAWIERMANQSGTDSPYRWSEIQGKSSTQTDKLRVLGYTLGRPEGTTPWLDALKQCGARIRGVYAPIMLTPLALQVLKIKPIKGADDISVLVTPHADGLRQTVLVGGRVRFSRMALNPQTQGELWFEAVYQETGKLREYLISNGLLKNDKVGMRIHAVLPLSTHGLQSYAAPSQHPKDRYEWIDEVLPTLVYVTALAKRQSWRQLAPRLYRKHDLSVHGSRTLYAGSALIIGVMSLYLLFAGTHLWQKRTDIEGATTDAKQAQLQYQVIAKTFPATPLTSQQLIGMSKRWTEILATVPPDMRSALVIAGQTLERHPNIIVEDLTWVADITASGDGADPLGAAGAATAAAPVIPSAGLVAEADKNKKEVTALLLRGNIRGIASDDLRGTRDALTKLEADFERNPKVRAEITKRPLDLSAKSSLTGSGTQDKAELGFEMKLWQR